MAIARGSQGTGVATETSSADCNPTCPATVNANDILIGFVYFEGTTTTPSTPSGWTLISGPHVVESTIGRAYVYAKLASGSEDGTAVSFGTQAVTTMRGARIMSFTGFVSGTIERLVEYQSEISHATDPQMPTVATYKTGDMAITFVAQNDDNAQTTATGMSGGSWSRWGTAFTAALTPGLVIDVHTATPTNDPGEITGGNVATNNDPVVTVGLRINQSPRDAPEIVIPVN